MTDRSCQCEKTSKLLTASLVPNPLIMANICAPDDTINATALGHHRIEELSADKRDRELILRSILLLASGPTSLNCLLNLVCQFFILGPVFVLGVLGSNQADLPQVDEAGNDLDESVWVVNEVTEREHKAFDQLALAADELFSRIDQLQCAPGLEEDLVVLEVEPSLGTGLHGAEGLTVVVT
jgi:hypothetical protein